MSLAMTEARYGAAMGSGAGGRGAYGYGPPAGSTTYGGSGVMRLPISRAGPGTMTIGPGGAVQGDPGLFTFLGKAVRGVTGIVSKLGIPLVSGAAGVASGLLGGGRGPGMLTPTFGPGGMPPLMRAQGQIPTPGIAGGLQRAFPGGATGMQGCPTGYRPNRSGYYVQGGQYVEPGTVCTKKRRMNPLNPRALSKAMRRIESAKRATTVLSRITIRKKCP